MGGISSSGDLQPGFTPYFHCVGRGGFLARLYLPICGEGTFSQMSFMPELALNGPPVTEITCHTGHRKTHATYEVETN